MFIYLDAEFIEGAAGIITHSAFSPSEILYFRKLNNLFAADIEKEEIFFCVTTVVHVFISLSYRLHA